MRRSRIKGPTAGSGVRSNSARIANIRIRCAIRTYDSITPGDYGFPHLTLSQGERGQRRWERQQARNRKGAYQAPFSYSRSMACDQCYSLSIGRGLHPFHKLFQTGQHMFRILVVGLDDLHHGGAGDGTGGASGDRFTHLSRFADAKAEQGGGALNSRNVLMRPSTGMPALVSAPVTPARLTR